jgi:uncharacterized membrane protein YoaK (UPF0700 family)
MGPDPPGRVLPFVLSLIAGSTDTISFLGLHGLFAAHITGNMVILAAHLITGDPAIVSYILAVPVFMLVLLLTSLFANDLERSGVATLRPLLSLQLLLLVGFLVLSMVCGARNGVNSAVAVVTGMVGVAAMAVQAALVQISLKSTPSTGVMTTNVTHFVVALAGLLARRDVSTAEKARKQMLHILPVISGFGLGCALGAASEEAWGLRSVGLPTALALLAVMLSRLPVPAN